MEKVRIPSDTNDTMERERIKVRMNDCYDNLSKAQHKIMMDGIDSNHYSLSHSPKELKSPGLAGANKEGMVL